MVKTNIQTYLERNEFSQKDLDFVDNFAALMIKYTTEKSIDQFAINVIGHIDNRMHSYIYNKRVFDKVLNKIFEQIGLEAKINSETPVLTNMETNYVIENMLNNVLATVIFFICLLSFILIFSLMQTDVEERKYEFAVLRTLGMRNQSLITLITI